jgi:hypothetical protein
VSEYVYTLEREREWVEECVSVRNREIEREKMHKKVGNRYRKDRRERKKR